MPLMASRRDWINVGLFVVFTIVFLSQTSVQDYLLSRSPHERLMTKWMGSFYKAIRAEALATPMHLVTQEEMRAAFGALERKIGMPPRGAWTPV